MKGRAAARGLAPRLRLQHTFMPAGDASLTTAQVNQKNPLTAITVSTAISETSAQNIPLKGRTVCGNSAEFRPQRLFAFELRRWEAQLGPNARISAAMLARGSVDHCGAGTAAIFGRSRDDPAAAKPATPLLTLRWTFSAKRAWTMRSGRCAPG